MAVFRKPDGTWSYRLFARQDDGTRWTKQESGYASEEKALLAQEEAKKAFYKLREANRKSLKDKPIRTLRDLFNAWIVQHKFLRHTDQTIAHVTEWFNRYCGAIADKPLCSISKQDVRNLLYSARKKDGSNLAPATLHDLHHGLVALFNFACEEDLIDRNPAVKIKMPPLVMREPVIYSYKQMRTMLNSLLSDNDPLYWPLTLTIRLGLRHGEVLALRWCDIDFDTGAIKISHSLVTNKGGGYLKEPKTKDSAATLYCSPGMLDELKKYKAEREAAGTFKLGNPHLELPMPRSRLDPKEFLCITREGRVFTQRYSLEQLHELQEKFGYERCRWHELRHAWATHLVEEDMDIAAISKGLRHAKVGVTVDFYVSATEVIKRNLTNTFDRCLGMPHGYGGSLGELANGKMTMVIHPHENTDIIGTITIGEDGSIVVDIPSENRVLGTYDICARETTVEVSLDDLFDKPVENPNPKPKKAKSKKSKKAVKKTEPADGQGAAASQSSAQEPAEAESAPKAQESAEAVATVAEASAESVSVVCETPETPDAMAESAKTPPAVVSADGPAVADRSVQSGSEANPAARTGSIQQPSMETATDSLEAHPLAEAVLPARLVPVISAAAGEADAAPAASEGAGSAPPEPAPAAEAPPLP